MRTPILSRVPRGCINKVWNFFKFKLITYLPFESEYKDLLFLSFLECVFLQCFLVLKIQNVESKIYFLININARCFSLFKAGVTRVSVNFVWVPGGVSRSLASIHPHSSIFFNTPVGTHVLLKYDFSFIFGKIIFYHYSQIRCIALFVVCHLSGPLRKQIIICDWCLSIYFVSFCLSRFVACDCPVSGKSRPVFFKYFSDLS